MNQYPCYIKINEAEGSIYTTGIEFRVFMDALFDASCGLLVLSGYPNGAPFDMHTRLEYIPPARIPAFAQENVYTYGDFCWVDFQSEDDLQKVSDVELAELLFAAHMKRPLNTPFWGSLKNSYLYLCHDDGFLVRLYMRDLKAYKAVIEHKIRSVLMGRKKTMSLMPAEILDALYSLFVNGGIIDFENTLRNSSTETEVIIYPARDTEFCPDDIHEELDHQRKIFGIGRYLGYNSKTQKWSLH